jgi:hypothetical protein
MVGVAIEPAHVNPESGAVVIATWGEPRPIR